MWCGILSLEDFRQIQSQNSPEQQNKIKILSPNSKYTLGIVASILQKEIHLWRSLVHIGNMLCSVLF